MTTIPNPKDVLLDVSVDDGKYRYILTGTGSHVYRHGESWQDATGNKMLYCAFSEIDRLRDALAAALYGQVAS